jgi:hypothetical protein
MLEKFTEFKEQNTDFNDFIVNRLNIEEAREALKEHNETKANEQHQKDFEIIIGAYLREKFGNSLKRPDLKEGAPDFELTLEDGRKMWLECCSPGENKRKYEKYKTNKPEPINLSKYTRISDYFTKENIEKTIFDPYLSNKDFRLTYYNTLQGKEEQSKTRLKNKTIKEDDFNILCINGYYNEKNKGELCYTFFENVKLSYINYEGRKIYRNLTGSFSSIGNLCSVLFSTITYMDLGLIDDGLIAADQPISGFLNEITGTLPFVGCKNNYFSPSGIIKCLKNNDERFKNNENYEICYYKSRRLKEDDLKLENYLNCDFFCREDFPFNGILFSLVNIDNIDGIKEIKETIYHCRNLETGVVEKVEASNSLIYLQNPMKPSCIKIFEEKGIIAIDCGVFYSYYGIV